MYYNFSAQLLDGSGEQPLLDHETISFQPPSELDCFLGGDVDIERRPALGREFERA